MHYEKPKCFTPKSVSVGKEVRGGESQSVPPKSTILTTSPEHKQAQGNPFKGFKSHGKVKGGKGRVY